MVRVTLPALIRWGLVIVLLPMLALLVWASEDAIDRLTAPFCPEIWWHTSEFWAHCAYPPASIAKYGAMYGGFALLALAVIHLLAPSGKIQAGRALPLVMMALPAYHVLLVKWSWVEMAKLCVVAAIAVGVGLWGRRVGAH